MEGETRWSSLTHPFTAEGNAKPTQIHSKFILLSIGLPCSMEVTTAGMNSTNKGPAMKGNCAQEANLTYQIQFASILCISFSISLSFGASSSTSS